MTFMNYEAEGQIGRLPLSPVQKIEQNIGVTDISIVYSRPSMRGRDIFGDLVPYDKLWRTGANRNTTIEFSKDVVLGDKRINRGKYAVFTIPSPKQWEVIIYTDTDNWDIPEDYDESKIVAKTTVPSNRLEEPLEVFSITIGDFTNFTFDLIISWSNTSVSIPIDLTTKEIMDKKIDNALSGPSYNDYYAAAEYQMEAGKEFQKGLDYINKAIEVTDEVIWWDLRIKAILLMELGQFDESLKVANEGLKMAEKVGRAYGINEFQKILKKLDK